MTSHYTCPVLISAVSHILALFAFNHPDESASADMDIFVSPEDPPAIPMLVRLPDLVAEPELLPVAIDRPKSDIPEPPTDVALAPLPMAPRGRPEHIMPTAEFTQRPVFTDMAAIHDGNAQRLGHGMAVTAVAGLDEVPRALAQMAPLYPPELRRVGVDGEAVIAFVVGTHGRVVSVEIEQATDPAFGEAAAAAVRKWRFEPGKRHGAPVSFRMSIPIRFSVTN